MLPNKYESYERKVKVMRKLIVFMLIAMLATSLIGCSSEGNQSNSDTIQAPILKKLQTKSMMNLMTIVMIMLPIPCMMIYQVMWRLITKIFISVLLYGVKIR